MSKIKNNYLNYFFLGINYISEELIIFIFLTILFGWKIHKRKWVIPLWVTFLLTAIVGFLLKVSVQRLRPFQTEIVSILPSLVKASYDVWNFSFPSSHAMFAFCALPILDKEFPKLKKVWITFAVLIALSRVYLGLHYFSDVVVGALIGYLTGWLIFVNRRKILKELN